MTPALKEVAAIPYVSRIRQSVFPSCLSGLSLPISSHEITWQGQKQERKAETWVGFFLGKLCAGSFGFGVPPENRGRLFCFGHRLAGILDSAIIPWLTGRSLQKRLP